MQSQVPAGPSAPPGCLPLGAPPPSVPGMDSPVPVQLNQELLAISLQSQETCIRGLAEKKRGAEVGASTLAGEVWSSRADPGGGSMGAQHMPRCVLLPTATCQRCPKLPGVQGCQEGAPLGCVPGSCLLFFRSRRHTRESQGKATGPRGHFRGTSQGPPCHLRARAPRVQWPPSPPGCLRACPTSALLNSGSKRGSLPVERQP